MTASITPPIDPAAARAKLLRLNLQAQSTNNESRRLADEYRALVERRSALEARALPPPPPEKEIVAGVVRAPTRPRSRVANPVSYADPYALREMPEVDWRARYRAEQEELAALDAAIEAVLARRDDSAATWAAQARVVANSRDYLARLTGKRIELF